MNKSYLLTILGVAALGGCGDSNSTSQVDAFIQTMAQQSCDWEFRCCKDPEIVAMDGAKFTTKDRCQQYRALALEDQLYIDRLAVKEGRLKVDGAKATACLAQLTSMACNPDPNNPNPNPMPNNPMAVDACANVFVGNTAVGKECIYSNECVTGAHCVSDTLTVGRGVCVPFQKVGEICNEDTDCDPTVSNIYCAPLDFTCHVRSQLGGPCAYTVDVTGQNPTLPLLLECDPTSNQLYCDPLTKSCKNFPGANQPCLDPLPPGVGEACNPDPTLDLVCDQGTTSGSTPICRAPGKLGDDCSQFPCDKTLYCDRTTATETCKALPTLGQPCQVSGDVCAPPYFCNFNATPQPVCAQPAQLGQNCATVTCDTGLYCDRTNFNDETCKAQLPDGSACTSSEQCLSLECFASGTTGETCQPRATGVLCIGR